MIRWALRMFRREWRQQVLVIALLTLTVAIAVSGVSAAYNMAPRREADFGTAEHRLVFDVSAADARTVDAYLAAAEDWFGTIDVIGQRRAAVPGSTETVELRAQDPDGPYGATMLRLRRGRYPARAGEVAVSDDVAQSLGVAVGDRLAIEGPEPTVVGVVENPHDLDDEFALLPRSASDRFDSLTVLLKGSEDGVRAFPVEREPGPGYVDARGATEKGTAAVGALAASSVVLLLVCLVAAAGFVVVAQRRLRQLGMLAATGATHRHLRLVVVADGAAVGAVAAIIGTVVGFVGWIGLAPRLEAVARHRIDRLDLPWPQVGLAMLLAVAAASAAAWWPARTLARVPVARALSGRPPQPRPARRSLLLALLLIAGGVACLMLGIDATEDEANAGLAVFGVLAIPLGVAMLCPVAVRLLTPVASRLPIAGRLALRDLARYQARAGAALAAITLGIGIAVAVVLAAAAAEDRPDEGNLSDRQLMVRVDVANEVGSPVDVPELAPAELFGARTVVDAIAETLGDPAVVALNVPRDPAAEEPRDGETLRPPVALARPVGDVYREFAALYVATPQALRHLGVDPASVDPGTEILAPQSGPLYLVGAAVPAIPVGEVQALDVPAYSSSPRALITPAAVERHAWNSVPAAWLVEAHEPLTGDQLAQARDLAAEAGLTVEARRGQEGLSHLRSGATAVGVLQGVAIVAMTVGLVRGETAGDLRMLWATGASHRIRRSMAGVAAGTLALLGAALGMAGAYAALGAGYADDIGALTPVPIVNLATIAVGLPLLAATIGWVLAGKEPTSLTRSPIE
ncbi:MAG TPA: FtsX-like permease family protein [Acidimicrobiales bacterium]